MRTATPWDDWPVEIWIAGERRVALRNPAGRTWSWAVATMRAGLALPAQLLRRD